ncbi:SHOCT domain-containing protein [Streptomyces sp. NPDC046197]|uniref:SHOCT domain-containing protein n=1 Tax=Streptomyces sp. NPDC046197 TaxID=3154337 RepID=UPI0033FA0F68
MFWYDHGMSGWGWFGASLGMIVFWGLIITVAVLLYRAFTRSDRSDSVSAGTWTPSAQTSPEQLLAERFARGEIDAEEYQRCLRVLRSHGADLTKH